MLAPNPDFRQRRPRRAELIRPSHLDRYWKRNRLVIGREIKRDAGAERDRPTAAGGRRRATSAPRLASGPCPVPPSPRTLHFIRRHDAIGSCEVATGGTDAETGSKYQVAFAGAEAGNEFCSGCF
jgi:hypothetical protein